MSMKRLFCASTLALAVFASAGLQAADAPPSGVRGAITAVNGDDLQVKTNRGEDVVVHLTADTQVRGVTLANIADIKPGSYIGSAAVPQADGTLKALEVHVFPPSMAGTGDGHRAFDLASNSSMTNGSVGDLVVANGRTITVKYKGGEQKILVPEDVPVVNLVPADRSLLKPGVKVVLFAQKAADGSYTAKAISAGENGLKPPM
ncbi:hypothetical protein HWQ56_20380 [Pseudomonas eucalypticola]|uniref:DUF5666 domain-containing protein n=2 Tax=Pseudomonas eucalypticola TaxID=2599595 RepID=A0A7D5D891_9PSED|nr:DUF5666 domain-containing protein [Pseudomonas eucalypticola]QKZ06014.1 hypothetical protein HWQ56_20380 [Pseudomonas eucalypticola]